MIKRTVVYFFLILFLSSCQSTQNQNRLAILDYEIKIRNYNCKKLNSEFVYINENLRLINKQIDNSGFDSAMETFVSLGTYNGGSRILRNNKEIFLAKKQIIINNRFNRSCYE